MDFSLKCNSLKCRAQLINRAVVTTCSHIFCENCSEQLGLLSRSNVHKACPACHTALVAPDDAVSTSLSPTEDYKTSVLSGLNPTTIIECAGRGLAFWNYQCAQEIVYQEYLAKTLTTKYQSLNVQVDKIINEANLEIENLNTRFSEMQVDQDKLKADNATLAGALREKARKHQQIQELYDRLKRKEMTAATQSAAFDSVDDVLQAAAQASGERGNGQAYGQYSNTHDAQPEICGHQNRGSERIGEGRRMMPPPPTLHRPAQGMANQSFRLHGETHETPQHRIRLGGINQTQQGSALRSGQPQFQAAYPSQTSSFRRPQSDPHVFGSALNSRAGTGYGLSAGMRQGPQQPQDGFCGYR